MVLAPKLTKFTTASPVILTFDSQDIISGTANNKFYPMQVLKDTATEDYFLSAEILASNEIVAGATTTGGSFTKLVDLDFDVTFNISAIVEGKAIIGFTHGCSSATSPNVHPSYVIMTILKDGVSLGTAQSATLAGNNEQEEHTGVLQIDLAKTHLPIGSVLRLTVEVWGKRTSGSGTSKVGIGIDPANRDNPDSSFPVISTGEPTIMTLIIPFNPNF